MITCHVGTVGRQLAEHGSTIDGSKKGKETGERRERGQLTGRTRGAVREKGAACGVGVEGRARAGAR